MTRRVALLLCLFPAASGCVSLAPLREQRYSDVTVEQLEKAARSDDAKVLAGLRGLLERRLEVPDDVEIDLALEALLALGAQGNAESFALAEHCAFEDIAEEVRYVALDVLVALDQTRARGVLERVAQRESSGLVREHANELTPRAGPR